MSADDQFVPTEAWFREQWLYVRSLSSGSLLVIDEIQKVPHWSSTVKSLWDEGRRTGTLVRVVLLGSASLSLHI